MHQHLAIEGLLVMVELVNERLVNSIHSKLVASIGFPAQETGYLQHYCCERMLAIRLMELKLASILTNIFY